MKKNITAQIPFLLFSTSVLFMLAGCKEEEQVDYQTNICQQQPSFVKGLGLDPMRAAFSTSEKKIPGLVLLQLVNAGDTAGKKIYQHPSWKQAGWMGPVQVDAAGNCFVAPVPVISSLYNPVSKQNTLYRVESGSGEMKVFASLPVTKEISEENPYGILGLAYLCESNTLYVSSVYGSTRAQEKGVIYAISAEDGKIIDRLSGIDAIGMGMSYITGQRTLYIGRARSSDVYSIALSKDGKFKGKPARAFSIAGLGPRGDDKVRRIKSDVKTGDLLVIGIEFNFNLTAATEKQETTYRFSWNEEEKSWIHNK